MNVLVAAGVADARRPPAATACGPCRPPSRAADGLGDDLEHPPGAGELGADLRSRRHGPDGSGGRTLPAHASRSTISLRCRPVRTAARSELGGHDPSHRGSRLHDRLRARPLRRAVGPFTALAAAATVSSTITVGTLVLDNDYRHPVVTAKEVATLDRPLGGPARARGRGGLEAARLRPVRHPMDPPKVRVDRMIEDVEVHARASSPGARSTSPASTTRSAAYDGLPKPHRPGGPPLLIGGGGPRMLRLAGATPTSSG